ncbi:Cof subfamily protein (haloacid dehalogenase superfamily) [Bacillus pakistanensis]|uniref:Cof subfamily protein (Haloacid dehalogenase superfamily) n=1 Tax=Rossellomorea pakistanensis TaxID=992288 RepID=A0ABS2NIW7_9BACI|nr:Cof-type HAD-IIB family hydrolase [Bacillus pakistanensis]MBM7587763.1 Cof subfamily protein (haloacid dehalogenase superfamily) [Bacillus pakistanensis]
MSKLIAIDLDGTLLNHQNRISDENLKAIKEAQQDGIEIVIATGRAHFDVNALFEGTGIETWIIAANGATIHTPSGELFQSTPIEQTKALEILQWLELEGYYYEVFSQNAILTPQNARELLAIEMDRVVSANPEVKLEELQEAAETQYSQSGFQFISSYKEIESMNVEVYNILAFTFHREKWQKGWEHFKAEKGLTLVSSAVHNFELEHKDASKGDALTRVAKELGIPLSDIVAVGDSLNDLSMLKIAGKSVAMGNAHPEVKEVCDAMTLRNDEHGVAHLIEKVRAL